MADTQLVTITIDGKQVSVPKGMNIIEAARLVGVEIPHYCYHPHLSVAGNCRMCQVKIEGQPKLNIACNTGATEGMIVHTQESAPDVAEAQRATLEFILINHPLDCTVCDQAGHCKLQDYYYEYNAKGSRFIEEKVHKVKAEVLGPEVIYDGERCILCTRCVRFCDEVTASSELGVFNRGDHSVIGISEGKDLSNPLSGSVVDLCPVGALTHSRWRFNTRIWYTDEEDSVCAGCSTGCNVKVNTRDGRIVHVKARLNSEVNKEWLCDEGRYGFERFQPDQRLKSPMVWNGQEHVVTKLEQAIAECQKLTGSGGAMFVSPFLTLEEMWVAVEFGQKVMGLDSGSMALQLVQRELTEQEAVLVSPDYAPNARAWQLLVAQQGSQIEQAGSSDWRTAFEHKYEALLDRVRTGQIKKILLVGARAIRAEDVDGALQRALREAEMSVTISPAGLDGRGPQNFSKIVLPGRTVNEKSGVMVNRDLRLQRLKALIQAPVGTYPEWLLLKRMASAAKKAILAESINEERALLRELTSKREIFKGLTPMKLGELGLSFEELKALSMTASGPSESAATAQR